MAILIPDVEEINSLPQGLTNGEKALMNALCQTLDDKWTLYIQPHLNGLRPDIVIFSEDAGIGIFEVKDWDLNNYQIVRDREGKHFWQVRSPETGKWYKEDCPFQQVEKYRQSIFKYEIPILDAKKVLNRNIYSLIVPFVYFHKHKIDDLKKRLNSILKEWDNPFGYDYLEPNKLRSILAKRYLSHGSKFTSLMQEIGLAERLANALAYPLHGNTSIKNLLKPFNKKQKVLLSNEPGSRRVKGAAGSGKTFVLVHKAVNAAREGKKVLLVCFNITMANNLRDLVTRLARYYDRHCLRNIEVGHFHRFFPQESPEIDNRNIQEKVDVLLIDEGQDFQRLWIETLQTIVDPKFHFMFCEDRRQNIYRTESIPVLGRPYELNESYRVPEPTAQLANFLCKWAKQEEASETVSPIKSFKKNFSICNIWLNGTIAEAINAIQEDINNLVHNKNIARPDIAILVCTVTDGWRVCQVLDELKLPYQKNFESTTEHKDLEKIFGSDSKKFQDKLDQLRRGYKAGFWMQGGKIKICTIPSFKGWELSHILRDVRLNIW
jgi:hypothetical protein